MSSRGYITNQLIVTSSAVHFTVRFSKNITLTCDLSIPKCSYLNSLDHRGDWYTYMAVVVTSLPFHESFKNLLKLGQTH